MHRALSFVLFSTLFRLSSVLGPLFTVLCLPSLCQAGFGFDAGQDVVTYVNSLDSAEVTGRNGQWLRVRGVAGSGGEGDHAGRTESADRAALVALHTRGVRVCVILRWGSQEWKQGARAGGGHRLPLDLREAYERGRRLGETYGDLVDVWEIENEPDIDFIADNPETFTAFQKSLYLGLKNGASASAAASLSLKFKLKEQSAVSTWREQKRGWSHLKLNLYASTHERREPLVIMAPLALPPGPYLERLWANGIGSYTEGFNYHYYGFADDFSGVYEQFRDAVATLQAESYELRAASCELGVESNDLRAMSHLVSEARSSELTARSSELIARKSWPIFITEYGYGLLDADSRHTAEGRVRQWRWFADVAEQIRDLRISVPMVFVLNPYHEANLNEFGLMAEKPMGLFKGEGVGMEAKSYELTANSSELGADSSQLIAPTFFTAADFGEKRPQAWMKRIGKKVGDWYASPALAYLWDYAERKPYRPRDWSVRAALPSPVVIDFIAGDDMVQRKVSGGYVLNGRWVPAELMAAPAGETKPQRTGLGRVVVYNFSDTAVSGRLDMTGEDGVWISSGGGRLTLAPGERRELGVELAVQAQTFSAGSYRVTFTPDKPEIASTGWVTRLLPDAAGMRNTVEHGFDFPAEAAAKNQTLLAARPLARGEAGLKPDGRWLVTDGVRVEERDGVWRFHIDYLPAEALRPAAVELPLPEGFVFPRGTWLTFERRIASAVQTQVKLRDEVEVRSEIEGPALNLKRESSTVAMARGIDSSRLKSRAGLSGDVMDVYFRTENGNLFQTWPRLRMSGEWTRYGGMTEDFTMGFFSRAALPWRFSENQPASLVFFLRPAQLPAVFEVRSASILRSLR